MLTFKKIILFLLLYPVLCWSSETYLICKGERVWSSGEKNQVEFEVTFGDDVVSMTAGLAPGCFKDDLSESTGCDCKVTERKIFCSSSSKGTKFKSHEKLANFSINRFSGRMIAGYMFSGDEKSGEKFLFTWDFTGQCEIKTERKF